MPTPKEPIWCEVRLATGCNEKDGVAAAKYYCNTEKKYVCVEDAQYCSKRAHNWRELSSSELEGAKKTDT